TPAKIAGLRVDNSQRNADGDRRIDRVSASLHDVEADLRDQLVLRRDHRVFAARCCWPRCSDRRAKDDERQEKRKEYKGCQRPTNLRCSHTGNSIKSEFTRQLFRDLRPVWLVPGRNLSYLEQKSYSQFS